MTDEHYGVKALPELYKEWANTGMVANIGTRIVEVAHGRLVLEGKADDLREDEGLRKAYLGR